MPTITLSPKWNIKLVEQPGAHFYEIEGRNLYLPGSTTVLGSVYQKPILVPWSVKMAGVYLENYLKKINNSTGNLADWARKLLEKKHVDRLIRRMKRQYKYERDKAADKGTRSHQYFDNLFTGKKQKEPPAKDIQTPVQNYLGWQKETGLRIIQGDTKIASLDHGYGGSLDAVGLNKKDRIEIIDYKTSNFTGKDYAYQVASYAVAAQETFKLPYLPDCRIIRFDREKPHWEERKIINTQEAFDGFLLCLGLYKKLKVDYFELVLSNHEAVANEKISKPRQKRKIK